MWINLTISNAYASTFINNFAQETCAASVTHPVKLLNQLLHQPPCLTNYQKIHTVDNNTTFSETQ